YSQRSLKDLAMSPILTDDLRKPLSDIITCARCTGLPSCRRPQRSQACSYTTLPIVPSIFIGISHLLQSLTQLLEHGARLASGVNLGSSLSERHIFSALDIGRAALAALHGIGGRAELDLGGTIKRLGRQLVTLSQGSGTLGLKGTMIYPLCFARPLQGAVLQISPKRTHDLDLRAAGRRSIEDTCFCTQPLGRKRACGRQDVGVMVALVAFTVRGMDSDICTHTIAIDKRLGECSRDFDPRSIRYLGRQGQLPFAGSDRIGSGLPRFGGVPQGGSILRPGRRIGGSQNESHLDAALGGVVVQAAFSITNDARGRPIGRRRRR
ncbi:hypothetical protein C8J30_13213, partial [Rhodobacter viridis]